MQDAGDGVEVASNVYCESTPLKLDGKSFSGSENGSLAIVTPSMLSTILKALKKSYRDCLVARL